MILDTGPVVAAANEADPRGDDCQELLREATAPLVVPSLVIAEAAYLIARDLGAVAEARLLRSLAHPRFAVVSPDRVDLLRMAELVEQHADLPLGATDAFVVALAERHGETEVATLDRRHFSVVRPRHVEALTLLP